MDKTNDTTYNKFKEYNKQYYQLNKEKIKATARSKYVNDLAFNEEHKQKVKNRYNTDTDHRLAKQAYAREHQRETAEMARLYKLNLINTI